MFLYCFIVIAHIGQIFLLVTVKGHFSAWHLWFDASMTRSLKFSDISLCYIIFDDISVMSNILSYVKVDLLIIL